MALIHGRKPFGAADMSFGEPGGTFGNMWEDGEPKYDLMVSGGGDLNIDPSTGTVRVFDYNITVTGGGDASAIVALVYKYSGTPTRAVPAIAVGPTQATLARP